MTRLLFLVLVLSLMVMPMQAGEFRFHHQVITGLGNVVTDSQGTDTHIRFHPESDAVAMRMLDALLDKRVYGTPKTEQVHDTEYNQHLVCIGEFVSDMKWTVSAPNTAPSERYRDFKLKDLKVVFPLHQVVTAPGGNEIDGSILIHVHLSFATLFPEGVTHQQRSVDLSNHAIDKTAP